MNLNTLKMKSVRLALLCNRMKNICILFVLLIVGISLNAQNAPSAWLWYTPDGNGDICIANVKVAKSTMYTYYSVMNWNAGMEGGGYCGIQDHPDGKNFIFSLWDPSNHQAITAPYSAQGSQIANFGGEGTGLHVLNFQIGWQENNDYTIVTRAWQYNAHTFWGFWSLDVTHQKWTHIVTMDYPVANVYFNGGMGQFIEDWIGSGQNVRKVMFNNIWKRYVNSGWKNFITANFQVNPASTGTYANNFDGGIESGYFYMQTGGNTSPTSGVNANLDLAITPSQIPTMPKVGVLSPQFNYDRDTKTLAVSWGIEESKSPQFSYEVALYDNSNLTGTPVASKTDKVPHQRSVNLLTPTLPFGTYTLKIGITDIFDQYSFVTVDVPLGPKSDQNINFPSIPDKTISDPPFDLAGTSSSGLAVSYSTTSDKVTISGSHAALVKAGRDTITASQVGNGVFNAALSVDQSFCIRPLKPTVTISNENTIAPTLTSSASAGNQWYSNGSPISGATSSTLTIADVGVYTVNVRADDCISAFSNDIPIIITGDLLLPLGTMEAYPNPVENYLEIRGLFGEVGSSQLTDMTGRTSSLTLEKRDKYYGTNVQNLTQGLYLLRIQSGAAFRQIKFIKK